MERMEQLEEVRGPVVGRWSPEAPEGPSLEKGKLGCVFERKNVY